MSSHEISLVKINVASKEAAARTEKARPAYRAPQLIVLGSAIELVQGGGNAVNQDGRGYFYRPGR